MVIKWSEVEFTGVMQSYTSAKFQDSVWSLNMLRIDQRVNGGGSWYFISMSLSWYIALKSSLSLSQGFSRSLSIEKIKIKTQAAEKSYIIIIPYYKALLSRCILHQCGEILYFSTYLCLRPLYIVENWHVQNNITEMVLMDK